MAFRIQDLMMDVRPGGPGGYQMANPECTCQITVKPGVQREPETSPAEDPGPPPGKGPRIPDGNPACVDTVLPSGDCPPRRNALRRNAAADLAALRAQLRSGLGMDAVLPG